MTYIFDGDNDDDVTVGDTAGKIGDAIKDDAEETGEHIKTAADWAGDRMKDAGDATENAAESLGVNSGNPNNDND